MWRQPYRYARCLVPALGWYEWAVLETAHESSGEVRHRKQPYFIHPSDARLICFAGLLGAYRVNGATTDLSCAILTRRAAGPASEIHRRMPVVLAEDDLQDWLASHVTRPDAVQGMIERARSEFRYHAVSARLNTSTAEDEALAQTPLP